MKSIRGSALHKRLKEQFFLWSHISIVLSFLYKPSLGLNKIPGLLQILIITALKTNQFLFQYFLFSNLNPFTKHNITEQQQKKNRL